ncbi:hypothetical protein, partial [Escherichia coli]|uniref:hypothetical protein n=1 Tax=Escherichia coli TaxID=562 RepID=UPI003D9C7DE6
LRIVGYANDSEGLEALVVEVDGTVDRTDGKIYHCTWSLDRSKGFKPADSNKLVSQRNWTAVNPPINISTKPMFFE